MQCYVLSVTRKCLPPCGFTWIRWSRTTVATTVQSMSYLSVHDFMFTPLVFFFVFFAKGQCVQEKNKTLFPAEPNDRCESNLKLFLFWVLQVFLGEECAQLSLHVLFTASRHVNEENSWRKHVKGWKTGEELLLGGGGSFEPCRGGATH